jgi:ferritin-like metal-binding protein YciE
MARSFGPSLPSSGGGRYGCKTTLTGTEAIMKINTLHEMFVHTLKDIHYAEKKILKALPKMIEAAQDEDLKEALTEHLSETEGQISRIGEVFALLEMRPATEECDAINGILKEADGMLEDTDETGMRDMAVLASGQAVEHYEMVRYRSLVMWSGALGLEAATPLLQQSLDEETRADEKLTSFAAYSQNIGKADETATSKGTKKPKAA